MLVARLGEPLERSDESKQLSLGAGRFVAPRFVDLHDRDSQLDRLVAIGVVDVRIHLERLERCVERRDKEAIYGTLVDLFIATDDRAVEVRRRALHWAGLYLDPVRKQFLVAHVDKGLHPSQPMPPARRSKLTHGVVGATRLVEAVLP